jgi:hypothetical protein
MKFSRLVHKHWIYLHLNDWSRGEYSYSENTAVDESLMISSFIDRLMPDHLKKSLLVDTAIINFYDDSGRIPSPLEIQALLSAHNANLSLNSRTPITPLSFKNSFRR